LDGYHLRDVLRRRWLPESIRYQPVVSVLTGVDAVQRGATWPCTAKPLVTRPDLMWSRELLRFV
jgi:hypothetical protein